MTTLQAFASGVAVGTLIIVTVDLFTLYVLLRRFKHEQRNQAGPRG